MSEFEKLKGRAANLTILAIILLVTAGVVFWWGSSEYNPNADPPDYGVWQFWLSGSLVGIAVMFFFFAQLFHIRAALEK